MSDAECWLCRGWGAVDKRTSDETAWSGATGGERGERFPLYSLHFAPGVYYGELIDCPICQPSARPFRRIATEARA